MGDEETKRLEDVSKATFISAKVDSFDLNGKKYSVVKVLSETSGEAQIYLVEFEGVQYVLKLYYPNFSPKQELLKVLAKLDSPYLVQLYDYGFLTQGASSRCYELMEYLEGGSLEDYPLLKNEEKIRKIALDTASALNICHQAGIIHRDVKVSNFFFRDKEQQQLVLGDFGISSLSNEDEELHKTTQARTPIYAAPEMYMQVIDGEVELSFIIDYYSLGITLLYLWLGKNPFTGNEREIMQQKNEGKLPGMDQLPPAINTLIRGLTVVNPEFRWGYEEVERWYNGENVPVSDDIPYLRYKKFLFDPEKELIAKNAKDMAELMKNDRNLGIRFLYNKRITKWLEESGNHRLAVETDEIVEKYFPLDQAAGVEAAIYILDREQPFLLNCSEPTYTPQEIVKAFALKANKTTDFKSLIDGRLLLWLSNKEEPELYDEISRLINGQSYSESLAFGVLYCLDKACGFNLNHEYTTPKEIAGLLSQIMISVQNMKDLDILPVALESFWGKQSRLYYFCKIHGWDDLLDYRDNVLRILEEKEENRLGEFNLSTASYQLCWKMGLQPGYLFAKKQVVVSSIEELKQISEREIRQEFRNGKLKEWLAVFYYANPLNNFDSEYSYEKSLASYLYKIEEFNATDFFGKRFFLAKERQAGLQRRIKISLRTAMTIDIISNILFISMGLTLIYFIAKYGIDDPELFIYNYFYQVVAPIGLFGGIYFGIKAFHLSSGIIMNILHTLLGALGTAAPAVFVYWPFRMFPGSFQLILMALILFYVFAIFIWGLRDSAYKIRKLIVLSEDNIQYTLIEPLDFAYKTVVAKYKTSNEKTMKEALLVISLKQKKLLTFYSVWILLGAYFLIIYFCFNSHFAGMEAPELNWENIKYFFRFRSN